MDVSRDTSNTIILGVFLGIAILVFGFLGLVGYYVWQIKFGDATALQKSLVRGDLTVVDGFGANARPTLEEDVSTYVRDYNPTRGSPDAPVTILAFIDFECPYSQRAYATFEQVLDEFGPAVRVVFKNFPLVQIHPKSNEVALAASCAQEQEQFWPFYQKLFEGKQFDMNSYDQYARELGMNIRKFDNCLSSEKYQNNIDTDMQDVIAVGARGTPTYFVNQTKIEGAVDLATWRKVIVQELQRS